MVILRRGRRRPRQIRQGLRVPRGVPLRGDILDGAVVQLGGGDGLFLEFERGFDYGGEEAGFEVPVDVAVEGPDAFGGGKISS